MLGDKVVLQKKKKKKKADTYLKSKVSINA